VLRFNKSIGVDFFKDRLFETALGYGSNLFQMLGKSIDVCGLAASKKDKRIQ